MGRTKGVKNKEGHKAGGARKGSGRKPKSVEDRSKKEKEITGNPHPHLTRILRNLSSTPNLDTKKVPNVLPTTTSTTRYETSTQACKTTTPSELYPVVTCTPDSPVWTRPPLPIPLSSNESCYESPSNSWSIISNSPHKAQPISDLATHGMRFTEFLPAPYSAPSAPQLQFTAELSSVLSTDTPISSPMCSPNIEISYPQTEEALYWDNPRYGSVTNRSSLLVADSASGGMYYPYPSYSPYMWPSSPVMSSSASQESPTSSYCSIESPITSLPSALPPLKARRRPRRCAVCLMYGEELNAYACPGRGDRHRCPFSRNYDTGPIPHGDIGVNSNCYSQTGDTSVLNEYGKYTEYDSNPLLLLPLRILLVDLDTAKFVPPQEEQEQPAAEEEIVRFVRTLNNSKNRNYLFLSQPTLDPRHLKDSHTFYKQDPYAVIELNGEKHQTKVEPKGGQHPVWDDEFRLDVYNTTSASNRILKISVFSKEYKEDELIGEAEIDIGETLKKGEFDEWVTLELNKSFKGEIYLEMTYYSAEPPLVRRPSKLSPKDRLSRPPVTPTRERTSPYLSPHGVTPGPGHHSTSSSTPHASSSAHSSPSSQPVLDIPPSLKVPQVYKDKHSTPSPSARVAKPLPSLSPDHQPQQTLQDHTQRSPTSPFHFPQPGLSSLPLSASPVASSTPPPPPKFQDPTLKNIPFLDVGPPFTAAEATSTTTSLKPLQHVPSVLRPTNAKSSPIPVQSRAPPPLPPRPEDPNELFRRQLEESDAEFAAKLAESEGVDLERLRMEEADAELARKMAAEESEGGASHIPGGWQ